MVGKVAGGESIYRLKATIRDIKPPVWRRLEVGGEITLAALHDVLQTAFGWTDSHLHQFSVGEAIFGVPDPDDLGWGRSVADERRVRLQDAVGRRVKRFLYEYDFGDGWEHEIAVERIVLAEPGASYPRCLAGRRACPPEDCGGPWGYAQLLTAVADPAHPEHEEMSEWLGGEFDPDEFELDAVNTSLAPLRPKRDNRRSRRRSTPRSSSDDDGPALNGASAREPLVERYARWFAAGIAKKRLPAPTPELETYLERAPEDVLVALESFAACVAARGVGDRLARGYLLLIEALLLRIRYRSDRGYDDAIRLIETFQQVAADLARAERIDAEALSMLAAALHQAGIAASPELSDAVTEGAEFALPDGAPTGLAAVVEQIATPCGDDPFLLTALLAETGHAMPADVRAAMVAELARSGNAVACAAAVLQLLDAQADVRRAAAVGLRIADLSPSSLRRLIAMRDWCPEAERQRVDEIVRAARAGCIECAAWPNGSAEAILGSPVDGSGAQGFLILSPAGKRKRMSSVLLKNGVRDAWTGAPESQRRIKPMLELGEAETSLMPVSRGYLDRAVSHHLALGIAAGALPPAGLLQVAETIGGAQWQPEAVDWRTALAAMVAELPAAMLERDAVRTALRASAAWADAVSVADSWFEDDQDVARAVGGMRGRRGAKATEYVLQSVLARRREKWAEHFLWTALWLREGSGDDAVAWRRFAILAKALADGHDLSEISLMRDIAARTVIVLAAA